VSSATTTTDTLRADAEMRTAHSRGLWKRVCHTAGLQVRR
jgi:hypothetical protein